MHKTQQQHARTVKARWLEALPRFRLILHGAFVEFGCRKARGAYLPTEVLGTCTLFRVVGTHHGAICMACAFNWPCGTLKIRQPGIDANQTDRQRTTHTTKYIYVNIQPMPHPSRPRRHALAKIRLVSVLRRHVVATWRTLEQKIADAGPADMRIDPHILTVARKQLEADGTIYRPLHTQPTAPWFALTSTPRHLVAQRLALLTPIYDATRPQDFNMRLGQTLEIAIFRALTRQNEMLFFGSFPDLDDHDDSQLYRKHEPPIDLSGHTTTEGGPLDFLLIHPPSGPAGVEAKNVREWLYPDRPEIKSLLSKCCDLDATPVLIARRCPYTTYSVLNPCGVVLHQTYNQLYPSADLDLAHKAKDKTLLGYHDIRVGNQPDTRLLKFITVNLPTILPHARRRFEKFKDLLIDYAKQRIPYRVFSWKVRRRQHGLSEIFPTAETELIP